MRPSLPADFAVVPFLVISGLVVLLAVTAVALAVAGLIVLVIRRDRSRRGSEPPRAPRPPDR